MPGPLVERDAADPGLLAARSQARAREQRPHLPGTDPDAEISPYEVEVTGWNQIENAAARTAFIRNVSDHCALFVEVL